MKKIIRIYLAVLCLAAGLAVCMISTDTVYADGSGDFEYGTYPHTQLLCVNRYTGSDKDVVIPGMIDGKLVAVIGDGIFEDSDITSVTIPAGVYKIEKEAFKNCENLTSVSIPGTVNTIEGYAFYGCKSLKNIDLPVSVAKIGKLAFHGSGLTEVDIPRTLTEIETCAFCSCKSLTKVHIPESVVKIGEEAFNGCSSLKEISISEGLTEIDKWAFGECQELTEVQLPNSIKSIGKRAFYNCNNLERVNGISGSNIEIGEEAFRECSKLESFSMSGVTKVGDSAFYRSGLKEMNLDEVTSIGSWAFMDSGLVTVNLPNVKTIGEAAFVRCKQLTEISYPELAVDGSLLQGCESLLSIRFPHGVEAIEKANLLDCKSLQKVSLSDTVTNIDLDAFLQVPLLEIEVDKENPLFCSIDGVLYNKDKNILAAFPNAREGDYHVPDGTIKIYEWSFYDCHIDDLYLPTSVTVIGSNAFKGHNIYKTDYEKCRLKNIYYAGTKDQWKKIQNNCIEELQSAGVTIHFKDGSTQKLGKQPEKNSSSMLASSSTLQYELTIGADNKGKAKVVRMIDEMGTIYIPNVVSVDGQDFEVTEIADGVLAGRQNIVNLFIGKNVRSIGKNAFKGCSKLKNIAIESTELKSVGKNAFKGIHARAKIEVPSEKLSAYKKLLKGKGQGSRVKIIKLK